MNLLMSDTVNPWDAAQAWHDKDHGNDPSSWKSPCFCCCMRCDPDDNGANPHFVAAMRTMPPKPTTEAR